MAYPILGTPVPQFLDSNGDPYVSGTITTQDPTDDSVKASYPTAADADASTNGTSGDITLDAEGKPTGTQYWGRDSEDYKVIIKDSAGAVVDTMDNIRLPNPTRSGLVTFGAGDSTPSVANGSMFRVNATQDITFFDDGQVGDVIYVYGNGSGPIITAGASMILENTADIRMDSGTTATFGMFTDQVWWEISRTTGLEKTVTGTYVIPEGENGKTYFLNSATEFTMTLPTVASGLKYKFIIAAAPSGADYVITAGSAIIKGGINEIETDTGDDGPSSSSGVTNINFKDGVAVASDWCEVISDGVNWFLTGQTIADGGVTLT
jgi:hypothetical protein